MKNVRYFFTPPNTCFLENNKKKVTTAHILAFPTFKHRQFFPLHDERRLWCLIRCDADILQEVYVKKFKNMVW